MRITRTTVMATATLSALLAGGGVLLLAQPSMAYRAATPQAITRAADGQFWADATTESRHGRARVHFLVDTGATVVAIIAPDARRMGLSPERLTFSRPVFTAQGEVRAAPVTLPRLEVAGVTLDNVQALVLKDGPKTSLLGMSYLGRLSHIEATPNTLTLSR